MPLPIRDRAALSAYLVLCGLWLALGVFGVFAYLRLVDILKVGGLCFGIGMLFAVWLRGFRIELDETTLTYRDGFYRTHLIERREIRSVSRYSRERWSSRGASTPTLFISYGPKRSKVRIHMKVFNRREIFGICERLEG